MTTNKNNYFNNSKNVIVSLVFIIPFLVLYELICFFYFVGENYQIRNSDPKHDMALEQEDRQNICHA